MKKKTVLRIALVVIGLIVIAVVVIFAIPWGEYESDIEKSEIKDTVTFSKNDSVIPPSIDKLEGDYFADKSKGHTAEILFNTEGLKKTKGGFDEFTISFNVPDDYKSSSLEVKIKTSSLNTGNDMRDEHLMEAEFFNATKFPEITYISKSVALGDTSYMAVGELTLNGVTKALDVPFSHLGAGGEEGSFFEAFEGAFEIDRTQFGQEESSGVGNIVRITFYCELVKR